MAPRSRPIVDLAAACACGDIGVTVRGRVLAMFLCSCENCQKATGAGHSAIVLAESRAVSVAGTTRSFAQTANSGATFTRHFCPRCGTPVFGLSNRAADVVMLPAGLFGAEARWFVPSQLIFARSHRDWDWLPEELPRYRTYRDEEGA
jgi:hypothetical protein